MMKSPLVSCTDAQLHEFLSQDEEHTAPLHVLDHIEQCSRCQSRLRELAASEKQWATSCRWLSGCDSTGSLRSHTSIAEKPLQDQSSPDWARSLAKHLLEPTSHPEMLGRIGRYDVERLIGSGGMGIVFKAYDTDLNRPVAIKVLAPYLAGNGAARQRFSREAKAAAAVVHDHVVPIHNVETNAESPYLVMHYVAGESLQSRIDRLGAFRPCEVLRIAMQVASGLAAAHSHGLVHRDIKPPNILLEQGVERSLITDFGLARTADDASLTNTGVHAGTPQYMSPEQAKGESIDAKSDLFSLGSTMYTMCTGRAPFRAETAYGILRKIIETEPHPIRDLNGEIPEWLSDIIARLMAKNPNDRFASARDLSVLLAECLAHVQTPTQHPLPAELIKPDPQAKTRKPILIGSVLILVCLFLGWLGVSMLARNSDNRSSIFPHQPDSFQTLLPVQSSEATREPSQIAIRPALSDAIRNKLVSSTVTPFESGFMENIIHHFEEAVGVPFVWNKSSFLDSDSVPRESIRMSHSLSGREALGVFCNQVGGAYIVHDDSIEICSEEYSQSRPSIRYFDLGHVLGSSHHMKTIVQAIETTIDSGSWESAGGTCSIATIDSVLIVRATERMHIQIELFLSSLTRVQSSQ